MNTTDYNVELTTERGLRKIELIGKVCTKQEASIKEDTAPKFVYNRIVDGHTAILEHEYVYFRLNGYSLDCIKDFCQLSPYIRLSDDNHYVGFSYRFFIDVIGNSHRTKVRLNRVRYQIAVNDIFYAMLYLTPELSYLMYDDEDILSKLHERIHIFELVERVYDETILKNAPEIFNVTFKITTDRGITHELVRHKEDSFMQESTRYCNYSKGKYGHSITVVDPDFGDADCTEEWADAMADAEAHYMNLLEKGATAQMARSVLPTSTKADIYMSGTLEMWLGEVITINTPKLKTKEHKGFLPLRNSSHAHPQMIPIAKDIERIIMDNFKESIYKIQGYEKAD